MGATAVHYGSVPLMARASELAARARRTDARVRELERDLRIRLLEREIARREGRPMAAAPASPPAPSDDDAEYRETLDRMVAAGVIRPDVRGRMLAHAGR